VSGQQFAFDHVFSESASQAALYEQLRVGEIVQGAFAGINGSVIAYGQTGAGKTHTMLGVACAGEQSPEMHPEAGIIPRALIDLFAAADERRLSGLLDSVAVRVSCVEVYCDKLRDLLAPVTDDAVPGSPRVPASPRPPPSLALRTQSSPSLRVDGDVISLREGRAGQVLLEGARAVLIVSAHEALRCVRKAATYRTTGSTAMNLHSSRSHAVFTLRVETSVRDAGAHGGLRKMSSELVFVDLAGSEGTKRTGAEGERQREAIHINLGLHHLNNVMHELAAQQRGGRLSSVGVHVNYRNCKLTR
jgi:kinesin family protein 4/21/27